jgi:hypothetical protein
MAGITERSAHGIVADLVAAGYVIKGRDGRRSRYHVQELPLRDRMSQERTIGEMLDVPRPRRRPPRRGPPREDPRWLTSHPASPPGKEPGKTLKEKRTAKKRKRLDTSGLFGTMNQRRR